MKTLPNIGLVGVQVPFVKGGAEILLESLAFELNKRSYKNDIIRIPFKWHPKEMIIKNCLALRMQDLTESYAGTIDILITFKFPSYVIKHPCIHHVRLSSAPLLSGRSYDLNRPTHFWHDGLGGQRGAYSRRADEVVTAGVAQARQGVVFRKESDHRSLHGSLEAGHERRIQAGLAPLHGKAIASQ